RTDVTWAHTAPLPVQGRDDAAGQAAQPARIYDVHARGHHPRTLARARPRAHRCAGGRGAQRGPAGAVQTRPRTYWLNSPAGLHAAEGAMDMENEPLHPGT